MKKIVFFIDKNAHHKIFEPFVRMDNKSFHLLVPANFPYKVGFSNTHIYNSKKQADSIIRKIKPEVFVQSRGKGSLHNTLKKMNTKMVLLDHGIFTNSEKVAKDIRNHAHVYERYDLVCSATNKYDKVPMLKNTKLKDRSVIVTGMPQFDNLYNIVKTNNFNKKDQNFDKTILFVGGHMILSQHNKYTPRAEYYNYLEHLSKVCLTNKWKFLIKPRADDLTFLKTNRKLYSWADKYANLYENLVKQKHTTLVNPDDNIYKYFNSDVVVLDGWSTAEIELCLANVPSVIIQENKNQGKERDYFKTVEYGAIPLVDEMKELESAIKNVLTKDLSEKRKLIIKETEIKFDGKSCERIIGAIEKL